MTGLPHIHIPHRHMMLPQPPLPCCLDLPVIYRVKKDYFCLLTIKHYYTEAKKVCFDANVSTENKQACKSVSENRLET